eukprot:scaffold191367_cov20-Tisochrysis_lutea.AAC.1
MYLLNADGLAVIPNDVTRIDFKTHCSGDAPRRGSKTHCSGNQGGSNTLCPVHQLRPSGRINCCQISGEGGINPSLRASAAECTQGAHSFYCNAAQDAGIGRAQCFMWEQHPE